MSWDGCSAVRFLVGCVRSSAFGVAFSKVVFLRLSALLDLASFGRLALQDADLIDARSLERELAGVVTFGNIGIMLSKVTFLHSFSFLLDLVLRLQLVAVCALRDLESVDSDSLEWQLSGVRTCAIIADIIVWSIALNCNCSSFI